MRAAVIDIGSNSTKLVIGENVGEEIKIIESLKNVIGIGQNTFYRGRISQEIFNQLIGVLEKYKKLINEYEVQELKVIATTAVREAENQSILLDTIRRKTGFEVEVLNVGDVVYYIDAYLSYKLKKAYPINEKNLLIIELGAGSLDISLLEKGFTLMSFGIPIGTLRLKQFKSLVDGSQRETYEALEDLVEKEILTVKRTLHPIKVDDIILIDESYSQALDRVLPNKKKDSSFFIFTSREAKQFLSRVTSGNLDDLAQKYHLSPDITDSIDCYGVIVNKIFKLIQRKAYYILQTSLSQAILANILFGVELSKKYNKVNQLVSVARFLNRKFDTDNKHTRQVANLSEELFHHFKGILGLKDETLLYLVLAAYLHNIGLFLNNRAHHKHTEYMVNALSLFRLTEQESRIIACIARYHRKAMPQRSHYLYNTLSTPEQILIQKLASILRVANALDHSHRQKVKKMEVKMDQSTAVVLNVESVESFALEKVCFADMKQLFEEISGHQLSLAVKKPV